MNCWNKSGAARGAAIVAVCVTALTGCGDFFTAPAPTSGAGLVLAYSTATNDPETVFDKVDRLRVRVTGGGLTSAIDTVLVFEPDAEQLSLRIEIPGGTQQYQVEVEMHSGNTLLFRGTTSASLTSGRTNTVTIQPEPVAAALELPDELPLFWTIGDTLTVPAQVRFASGDVLNGAAIVWSSSNPDVVSVNANGRLLTHRPGDAVLRAQHTTFVDSVPVRVRLAPDEEHALAVGMYHTCVISEEGITFCGGDNTYGQRGNGAGDRAANTLDRVAGDVWFKRIDASWLMTCGLNYDGRVFCWGLNVPGAPAQQPVALPAEISGGLRFRNVSVGNDHVCGIATDGGAYCAGNNRRGQLGVGDTLPRTGFQRVPSPEPFVAIDAGLLATCGLTAAGAAHCFGWNVYGQTGIEPLSQAQTRTDLPVPGGLRFSSVAVSAGMACGISNGTGYCWGGNFYGSLGRGSVEDMRRSIPDAAVVGGLTFRSLVPSDANSIFAPACALTTDGTAYCWGANSSGQLGTVETLDACSLNTQQGVRNFACTGAPARVATSHRFVTLKVAGEHACGITTDRRILCWGNNERGQLGDGTTQSSMTPVAFFPDD